MQKQFLPYIRIVLAIAKACLSLGILQGAATSAALVAGVSLMSMLLVGDWAEVLLQLDTIF